VENYNEEHNTIYEGKSIKEDSEDNLAQHGLPLLKKKNMYQKSQEKELEAFPMIIHLIRTIPKMKQRNLTLICINGGLNK